MLLSHRSRKTRRTLFGLIGASASLWIAGVATIPVLRIWAMPIIGAAMNATSAWVVVLAALNVRDRHGAFVLKALASRPASDPRRTTKPLRLV